MIDKLALSNSTPLGPQTPTEEIKKPSFGMIKTAESNDKFENSQKPQEKKLSKLNMVLMGITGASVGALALTRAKLGKIINLVGEDAPKTIFNRLGKVANLTAHDGMTGLFNKKALLANLNQEYGKAIKEGKHLSVAMLDMDNFKGINEVFNHDTGDVVLKRIASIIQDVAEEHGLKGFRYGGEEFVVVLPGHDSNSAQEIINKIAEKIKKDTGAASGEGATRGIQSYLTEFVEKAKEELNFFEPRLKKLNDIFAKLRNEAGMEAGAQRTTNQEIATFIEEHISKCKPADTRNLDEILTLLKKEPPAKADLSIPIGKDSTIGSELDKIYNQYKSQTNDLIKWTDHVNKTNVFTVSGGIADLSEATELKNGASLVKLADAALKGAKENGKNQITIANETIISEAMKHLNK